MPITKMHWLLDAFGQNVLGWILFGGGLVAIYTVLYAIWSKLTGYELLGAICTFASGWIFVAVLWLQRRSAKLVIHEAKWGIGDARYRDVTVILRGYLKENAINVPVTNETFQGDPYAGVRKHLIVRYSYGRSGNKEIIRHETDQLILPEREDRASSIFVGTRFESARAADDQQQLHEKENRRAIRDQIAALINEGNGIKAACGAATTPEAEAENAANLWAQNALNYLDSIEASYSARFNASSGPSYAGVGQGTKGNVWNYVNRRVQTLTQLLQELRD
jgi:hypothetical protein